MDGMPNKQNRHSRTVTDSNRQVPPAKKPSVRTINFFILLYSEFGVKKMQSVNCLVNVISSILK